MFANFGKVIFVFLLFARCFSSYATLVEEKNVLVIHSYHQGLEWSDSITAGINSVFRNNNSVNLYFEYLDTKRNKYDDYIESIIGLYRSRTSKIKYDAIITCDNAAYDFMQMHRDEFFPEVPVFFCGVNFIDKSTLYNSAQFYGFEEVADHLNTIRIAKKLFPHKNKMLIVNDYTLTGKQIRKELESVLYGFEDFYDFEILDTFSTEELTTRVKELNDDFVIYLLVVNRDRFGNYISYRNGIEMIDENTLAPIFGSWDFYLGKGIVGGSITYGFNQGQEVGKLALQYLHDSTIDIPQLQVGYNAQYFDYEVLSKFNISENDLPTHAKLINKPKLSEKYLKIVVRGFIIMVLILIFLIIRIRLIKVQEKKLNKLVIEKTKELQETNLKLRRVGESKDEILRVVSHDLRNPITNICGFMDLILQDDDTDGFLDKDSREAVEIVHKLGLYMSKLVHELLDLSVIESGYKKLSESKFDYILFIKNVILFNDALSRKYDISIELVTELSKLFVVADEHQITQVLQNLISNAFKFSPKGSEVYIMVNVDNGNVVTTVRDSGCGIEEDKFDVIFKKFEQVNPKNKVSEKGIGLGLSIVKAIIAAHQGQVSVKSELGKGCDLIFTLPLHVN